MTMRPRTDPSTALGTGLSTVLPEVVERDGRVVIVIPMQLKRRGNRKEIMSCPTHLYRCDPT
jgi:hypothetical protein